MEEMRSSEPSVSYLVGAPRGRLTKLEKKFMDLPWEKVRDSVEVKLLSDKWETSSPALIHPA